MAWVSPLMMGCMVCFLLMLARPVLVGVKIWGSRKIRDWNHAHGRGVMTRLYGNPHSGHCLTIALAGGRINLKVLDSAMDQMSSLLSKADAPGGHAMVYGLKTERFDGTPVDSIEWILRPDYGDRVWRGLTDLDLCTSLDVFMLDPEEATIHFDWTDEDNDLVIRDSSKFPSSSVALDAGDGEDANPKPEDGSIQTWD